MGFGEALFPLPWSYLNYDAAKDGYVLNISKQQLATAPKFKPSEVPEFTASYRQGVARFYGRALISDRLREGRSADPPLPYNAGPTAISVWFVRSFDTHRQSNNRRGRYVDRAQI